MQIRLIELLRRVIMRDMLMSKAFAIFNSRTMNNPEQENGEFAFV